MRLSLHRLQVYSDNVDRMRQDLEKKTLQDHVHNPGRQEV